MKCIPGRDAGQWSEEWRQRLMPSA